MACTDRIKRFTDAEFKALERYTDGSVVDLGQVFMWFTDKQREQLSGDDWSRVDEYEEEARCLLGEFMG